MFYFTNMTTFNIGDRVEVYCTAEEQGIGTIVESYFEHAMDVRMFHWLVRFDDGREYWTSDHEMRAAE